MNVALVDTRAWDTFGEISVLVIAATGVASLIFLQSRVSKLTRTDEALAKRNVTRERIRRRSRVAARGLRRCRRWCVR